MLKTAKDILEFIPPLEKVNFNTLLPEENFIAMFKCETLSDI